ncbi:CsbD family protein [Variovorax sp. J22P271]|uniref:CsbD family protein n=1 Tax=Variovorax davisae TaxID=3053515 RepID=UPI002576FCD1|nr:CsbD family protein [Variovorax sp. J22P271]MDM0032233.1 CsbD family protein [Variovorax sp. J22P271]
MNKDQVKGTAEKAKGSVKETVGKVVGSDKMEAEGAADKAAGSVQKKVGDVKEAAKDAGKTLTKKP